MGVQAWIIMDEAQKDAAKALNGDGIGLDPRLVDNPLANNLGFGVLLDCWVAPARLLNDPEHTRWVPTLGTFPIHVLDDETIFLPPDMTDV